MIKRAWRSELVLWLVASMVAGLCAVGGSAAPAGAAAGTIRTVAIRQPAYGLPTTALNFDDEYGTGDPSTAYRGHDAYGAMYFDLRSFGLGRAMPAGLLDEARPWSPEGHSSSFVGLDGSVYRSSYAAIDAVAPDGSLTRIAGTGLPGSNGDGGPATAAQIYPVLPPFVAPDGTVRFVDGTNFWWGRSIRQVTPGGIIKTIAGNGNRGDSGDGGWAVDAEIDPAMVTVDGLGRTIFAQRTLSGVVKIRRVEASGRITSRYVEPDTRFEIASMVAAPDGWIYFTEKWRDGEPRFEVLRLSPAGVVTTVAGNGSPGSSGDGGRALAASVGLWELKVVDVLPDGTVIISDGADLRAFKPGGNINTIAGAGSLTLDDAYPQVAVAGDNRLVTNRFMVPTMSGPIVIDGQPQGELARTPSGEVDLYTRSWSAGQLVFERRLINAAGKVFVEPSNGVRSPVYRPSGSMLFFNDNPYWWGDCSIYERPFSAPVPTSLHTQCWYYNNQLLSPDGDLAVRPGGMVFNATYAGITKIASAGAPPEKFAGGNWWDCSWADGVRMTQACLFSARAMITDGVGNIYVSVDSRVRKIDLQGIVTTVAGLPDWGQGDTGDGGPATAAGLATPSSLAFDSAGNLYISTLNAIRVVEGVGTMGAAPTAPTSARAASDGPLSAFVTWVPATNSRATSYTITAQPGGSTVIVPASQRSATVAGLKASTTYTFLVRANNPGGTSAPVRSNSVTTASPPSAPRSVTATRGLSRSVRVSWAAPASDGGTLITSYRVRSSPDAAYAEVVSPTATFTNLASGTYTFSVVAVNAAGESLPAVSRAITIP